jgi:gliding motility-associated-like protein
VKPFISIVILFWAVQCTAQNLILNHSFEDTAKIINGFDWPAKWEMAAGGNTQPEYYNEFQTGIWTVPKSFFGYQYPQEGTKYLGMKMYYFVDFSIRQRDYIQTNLKQSLLADTNYCLRIHVNLPDSIRYASRNQLGIYFSNTRVSSTTNFNLPYTPQIIVSPTDYIIDKENWTVFNHTYKATGGERFLVMGNFNDTTAIDSLFLGPKTQNINFNGTYYFIDNLYLGSCDSLPISFDGSVKVNLENAACYSNSASATINYNNEGEEWLDFTEDTLTLTAEVRENGVLVQTITQETNTNALNPIPNHPLIGGTTAQFPLQGLDFSTIGATYNLRVSASFNRDEVAANNVFDTTFITKQEVGQVSISDDTLCAGAIVALYSNNNTGTAKWQFSTDQLIWQNLPEGDSAVHTPTATPTFYRLSVCDVLYSDTFQVVNPTPVVIADTAITACNNTDLTIVPFISSAVNQLNWYTSSTAEIPFYKGLTYTYRIRGNQTFYITPIVDSCESDARSEVTITAAPCELLIPNIFTPNGDGLNDVWEFQNVNNRSLKVVIYNRWGAVIANWKGNQPWDGENVPSGVYYYIVETEEETYRGTVSILK